MTQDEAVDKIKEAADKYFKRWIKECFDKQGKDLIKNDKKELMKLARLISKGPGWRPEAVKHFWGMDSILREVVPSTVFDWIEIENEKWNKKDTEMLDKK